MSDKARGRELPHLRAVLDDHQGKIGRGSARRADMPHPREYDANGFPVPQRTTSFGERVARLLNAM